MPDKVQLGDDNYLWCEQIAADEFVSIGKLYLGAADSLGSPVSEGNPLPVEDVGRPSPTVTTFSHGNKAVTTSVAVVGTAAATKFVRLVALSDNTAAVFVGIGGTTTGTGIPLYPGDVMDFPVDNVNRLYAVSASGTQNVRYAAF